MKYSLESIHKTAVFFNGHLWTIRFADETVNILNAGGDIGKVFPASNVTEPLSSIMYDSVSVGNGTVLDFPKVVSYQSDLGITFYHSGKTEDLLKLNKFFIDWTTLAEKHNGSEAGVGLIRDISKRVFIHKYSRTSRTYVLSSEYIVLPPDNLSINNTADVSLLNSSINLKIIGRPQMLERS